jgi:molybdate transport system permease protein
MSGPRSTFHPAKWLGIMFAACIVVLLAMPLFALAVSTTPSQMLEATAHPMFAPALWMSLKTTSLSLLAIVVMGTPLAWWLATSKQRLARGVALLVELPVVVPPAVIGVALLMTFGRQGLLGGLLTEMGISVVFTTTAVIMAQVVVASPFYIKAATSAFAEVDPEFLIVARSLGATPAQAIARVALPMAWPGLFAGASVAWARALGEFGATLLFAGNMTGRTQTMPLAIFGALEVDVQLAVVFSLILVALGALILGALQYVANLTSRDRARLP